MAEARTKLRPEKRPKKGGEGLGGLDFRQRNKLLQTKLNILNLAEDATEEDLDAMLSLWDEMDALMRRPASETGITNPSRTPEMKEIRQALDSIAKTYGGLRRVTPFNQGPRITPPTGERVFTKEAAARVKELRKMIKDSDDPDLKQEMRQELQVRICIGTGIGWWGEYFIAHVLFCLCLSGRIFPCECLLAVEFKTSQLL